MRVRRLGDACGLAQRRGGGDATDEHSTMSQRGRATVSREVCDGGVTGKVISLGHFCRRVVGRKVEAGEHRARLGHSACTKIRA